MNIFDIIGECLGHRGTHDCTAPNEKSNLIEADAAHEASRIVEVLRQADKPGAELNRKIKQIYGDDDFEISSQWAERLAEYVLAGIEKILKEGQSMGTAVKDAMEKAMSAAVGFAQNHPVYATLIALGILALLVPWAIEALGFGELGPIEGESGQRLNDMTQD